MCNSRSPDAAGAGKWERRVIGLVQQASLADDFPLVDWIFEADAQVKPLWLSVTSVSRAQPYEYHTVRYRPSQEVDTARAINGVGDGSGDGSWLLGSEY
eukprot:scaffold342185_cov36-Prasinocladus_malaysianus.AAC.1